MQMRQPSRPGNVMTTNKITENAEFRSFKSDIIQRYALYEIKKYSANILRKPRIDWDALFFKVIAAAKLWKI